MKNKQNQTQKIAILGGGLAGLTAAYELSRAGFEVEVIEKNETVGGLARTIEKNGFKFDTGPHRWYTKNDMVNNWMLKLMEKEIIKVPRLTRIYFDKKFFNYPVQIKSTLQGMGIIKTLIAVLDYFKARIIFKITRKKAITIEEGYIAQFGKTLYEMFFKRYTEKLWGTSCKNLSADWIGQRSRGFSISTIIKSTLFPKEKVVSFVDQFYYPKKGIGRIADKLSESIIKNGGSILLNTTVTKINYKKDKISSVEITQNKSSKIITADEFISTIPLSELINNLQPKVTNEIIQVSKKLKYRDEVQIVLFINKTKITPDTWIYVHQLELPFVRFMEMDNWSKWLSPKGTASIVFEVACNYGDTIWNKSNSSLIQWVSEKFINEFNYISKKDIIGSYVHRVTGEYPVYHIGYQKDVEILKKFLNNFKNLQIAGRNGIFRYNNMDHSIEMGLYAGWNIIEGERKFDIENVNIEREYLEEKKIDKKDIEFPDDQYVETKTN